MRAAPRRLVQAEIAGGSGQTFHPFLIAPEMTVFPSDRLALPLYSIIGSA